MKRVLLILLFAALLTSCKNDKDTEQLAEGVTTSSIKEAKNTIEPKLQTSKPTTIPIRKTSKPTTDAKSSLKVTVSNMFTGDSIKDTIKKLKVVSKNKDYTTTYKITKKQQENILKEIRKEFDNINEWDKLKIKTITVNNDFSEFKVSLNSSSITDKTGEACFGLLLYAEGYQGFSGIPENKRAFKIIIKNNKGKLIKTYTEKDFKE